MIRALAALLSGTIFGLGLAVSGMMNPAKVIGFLDVAGDWDPTLAFVMGGALLVTVPGYRLVLSRRRPVLERGFDLPKKNAVDGRLVGGAALFGVGWGLVGFCPGPAVAALATGLGPVLAFVAAMIAGMAIHRLTFERRRDTGPEPARERPAPSR
ncbi:MAG: YeeE/YedE family protein [Actinomycetota bacterium]